MPTKYLGYELESNSTGIADLSYQFRDINYDSKHQDYPPVSMREERYYGAFGLTRKINMKTAFDRSGNTEERANAWLPCCFNGIKDMTLSEKEDFAADPESVFDCTCYKEIKPG
jgi:hypothetical protein